MYKTSLTLTHCSHKVLTRQDIAAGMYRLRERPHKLHVWLCEKFGHRPHMHISVEPALLRSWVVYDEFLSFIALDNAGNQFLPF